MNTFHFTNVQLHSVCSCVGLFEWATFVSILRGKMTEVSGRMYPVSSNKFCLAPWTPFALAELKPGRRRDLDSVFMLVPRSIDPSCVISPAFWRKPLVIFIQLSRHPTREASSTWIRPSARMTLPSKKQTHLWLSHLGENLQSLCHK